MIIVDTGTYASAVAFYFVYSGISGGDLALKDVEGGKGRFHQCRREMLQWLKSHGALYHH